MALKNWRELVRADYPDLGPVTKETVEKMVQYSQSGRYSPLPMRLGIGRRHLSEDYEARRKRVLSTPFQ